MLTIVDKCVVLLQKREFFVVLLQTFLSIFQIKASVFIRLTIKLEHTYESHAVSVCEMQPVDERLTHIYNNKGILSSLS